MLRWQKMLNLSRNVVAMEKAISLLKEAERCLDECRLCLLRDVIVSEGQAAEHNRSIVCAKDAVSSLKEQLVKAQEEVAGTLEQAQRQFVLNRDFTAVATGYTAVTVERPEPDLSSLAFVADRSGSAAGEQARAALCAQVDRDASAAANQLDGDEDTVKGVSEDGFSYDGTVVLGGLRHEGE